MRPTRRNMKLKTRYCAITIEEPCQFIGNGFVSLYIVGCLCSNRVRLVSLLFAGFFVVSLSSIVFFFLVFLFLSLYQPTTSWARPSAKPTFCPLASLRALCIRTAPPVLRPYGVPYDSSLFETGGRAKNSQVLKETCRFTPRCTRSNFVHILSVCQEVTTLLVATKLWPQLRETA